MIRLLLQILFAIILPVAVTGQTFSFTSIPYGSTDFTRPGGGPEQWHNGSQGINYPTDSDAPHHPNVYHRLVWTRLEGSTQDSYTWTDIDGLINAAIDSGQKISLGVMSLYSESGTGKVSYGGAESAYPLYLHNLMQGEANPDYIVGGNWVPNWNSSSYLSRLLALNQALNTHLLTTSRVVNNINNPKHGQTVPYKDAIFSIDIRGYGNYGEWHMAGVMSNIDAESNSGTRASEASLNTIIDHHVNVFQDWPLSIMIAAFDGERLPNVDNPIGTGFYAATRSNDWGPVGWRRDQWGLNEDGYIDSYLKDNTLTHASYPGFEMRDYIMELWKTSPITGEPPSFVDDFTPSAYHALEAQVITYNACMIGNGNYGMDMSSDATARANVRAAFKRCGYRIELTGGNATATGSNLTINLNWKNVGVAPTYDSWHVIYELRNWEGVIWSDTSYFNPKRFLPSASDSVVTDIFSRSGMPAGNYSLWVRIEDSLNYNIPLPLAITGRQSDGSYQLLSSIDVPASGGNEAPVANAGSDVNMQLPTSSANLSGAGSTDDVGIISWDWIQLSGPNTATIGSPNSMNTSVSNLVAGTYVFRLIVGDAGSLSDTDDVTVTVTAQPTLQWGPFKWVYLDKKNIIYIIEPLKRI